MKASPCLESALSPDEWVSGSELEQFRIRNREDERAVIVIARDFVFTCAGSVKQWKIRWHYRDASPGCATVIFTLLVLRQTESCGMITIKGQNTFPVVVDSSRDQIVQSVFDVDIEERVSVLQGDFIGVIMSFMSPSCSDIRARVSGVRGAGETVYYGQFDTFLLAPMPGVTQPCLFYTAESLIKPFFTAVIGKCSHFRPYF